MNEVPVKVKTEKVDPEIEEKIKEQLNINVKKEQESSDSGSSSESNPEEEIDDKKNIELQKSSNELLTELFQVFNVEVKPDELFNDDDLLKKAKKSKKSKKHKKEKRKKHKKDKKIKNKNSSLDKQIALELNDSDDQDTPDVKKEKHKDKKKKRHKNKDEHKHSERSKSKEKVKIKTEPSSTAKERDKQKSEEHHKGKDKPAEKSISTSSVIKKESHDSSRKQDDSSKKYDDSSRKHDDSSRKHTESRKRHASETKNDNEPPPKIKFNIEKSSHNNFYNGHSNERSDRGVRDSRDGKTKDVSVKSEHRHRSSERTASSRRHDSKSRDRFDRLELSDLSLSDEETYLRERARPTDERHRSYDYYQSRNRRDLDRRRRRTPSRSRRRSRSRDLGIDKKRLLEIARKNAISMFKRGSLPGCANMTEDVKDKVLLQMRYGGRTVQDLTDFCRKISKGEPLPELCSDDDSDIDRDGNAKPFHHPFQVKDRDPIVLQLRNTIPLPVSARREDQTKAITMQFPVSSGQEHRKSESWIPVEAKPTPLPALPAATQSTNMFKQVVPKNVFEKALPVAEQQEPAFKPVNASVNSEPDSTSTTTVAEATETSTDTSTALISAAEVTSTFVPDVPIPSSTTSDSVFPEVAPVNVDVSSIISKRLTALRRLQENPMDSEAIKIMYNSQKEMSSWASSKHLPGQFTGSTGANVLRAHELSSGPQVWTRRDQLTSTKPVTGGMGMHLLQKMGWKPGEGLGKEKKGALQPLLLDVKLDKRGLVAKDDTGVNGVRTQISKKRPNTAQEVIQSFQNKHPVCILNELTSKRKWTPPMYNLVTEVGPSHGKKFLFSVSMNGQEYVPPEGSNTKKEAKMLAAKFCLEQIGILQS